LHLLRDVVQIAQRTLPAGITVRADLPRELGALHCDPTQIHQVLLNLVVNARDAMPGGGTLSLSAKNVSAAEVSHRFAAQAAAGDYVLVEIADTGEGIPEDIREKVFEPFFTTKAIGKGTGLGLSTSLGIVKSHGGFFDFQTEIGRGTTFRVYLPGSREGEPKHCPPADRFEMSGKSEVVLIIDDELGARELTKTVLSMNSYQVLTAENGAEGVNLFKRFNGQISAVLVDRKMPLMDGPETIRAIRQLSPEVKIIATTGQAAILAESDFAAVRIDAFLPKPFSAEEILQVLHDCFQTAP
jgi:CheY-like chemotaxis protein